MAIEAYEALTKVFADKQWKLKTAISDLIAKEEIKVTNEIKSGDFQRSVEELVKESETAIVEHIENESGNLRMSLSHYFECIAGCDDCSKNVKNRQFLIPRKDEFLSDVETLKRRLFEEMKSMTSSLETPCWHLWIFKKCLTT